MLRFSHKIIMIFYGCKILHQSAPVFFAYLRALTEQAITLKLVGEIILRAIDCTCRIRSEHY